LRIQNNISDLPTASTDNGVPPVSDPQIGVALAQAWFDGYVADGNVDKARAIPESPYRASYASKRCDRQLYYALSNTPESEPLTIASAWTMGLGTMVHEHFQAKYLEMFPDALVEPVGDLRPIGIDGSGHADIVVTDKETGERTLVELKTTGGFSFKMMATTFKGAPQGPRFSYLLQSAMMAKALDCDKVIIVLLSLEPVSAALAEQYSEDEASRFVAEWHYDITELLNIIEDERVRVNHILHNVRLSDLPRRIITDPEFPAGATVTAPLASRAPWVVYDEGNQIVDSGQYWGCAYCAWRTQCHEDGE